MTDEKNIEEYLEEKIETILTDARYSAETYFHSQFNTDSKSLYDLEKKEDWVKVLNNLIAQCKAWMGQLKIYGEHLLSIINRAKRNDKLNNNAIDSQKIMLDFQSILRKIFLLYEKGDILLQKIRVVTTKNAEPTHYNLLLSIDKENHTIDEILLDIPQMFKAVSTGLKKDKEKIHSVLDFLKKLNFNLSKSKVTNLYRDVSAVHLNSTEANPQAAQRQQELQEGYSVVSEIYSALYGEDWKAGHSYESFVKGLKNYKNFVEVTSKIAEQEDSSFYSSLPKFVTMTKEKGKIIIQAREYEGNSGLTKQSEKFYQKYQKIFDILQDYSTDNIPSIAQGGDEERYLIFSKDGIMQDIEKNEENKIEVELKNLINGSADFITGNLIITGISNSITNLEIILTNLQEGKDVEQYLKQVSNRNRGTDAAKEKLKEVVGKKIAEANDSFVEEVLKMWEKNN